MQEIVKIVAHDTNTRLCTSAKASFGTVDNIVCARCYRIASRLAVVDAISDIRGKAASLCADSSTATCGDQSSGAVRRASALSECILNQALFITTVAEVPAILIGRMNASSLTSFAKRLYEHVYHHHLHHEDDDNKTSHL